MIRSNVSIDHIILMPNGAFSVTELEIQVLLNIVVEAATRLRKRLDLIYGQRIDGDGRKFSGLHEAVLRLAAVRFRIRLQRKSPGSV